MDEITIDTELGKLVMQIHHMEGMHDGKFIQVYTGWIDKVRGAVVSADSLSELISEMQTQVFLIKKLNSDKEIIAFKPPVIKSLPSEDDFYYEISFGKHCYKYQLKGEIIIIVTDEKRDIALQKMFDELWERGNNNT